MEKKYDLEDFVSENIDLFNTEEPPEGHFDRFKEKLEQNSASKGKSIVYRSLRYAAVIVLLISAFFVWQYTDIFTGSGSFAQVSDEEEEFTEIANYYDAQINEKYNELNSITCKAGNEPKTEVNNDLLELTGAYEELENEYKENPDNEIIKDAIIQNYQMRLDILDMVIGTLKNYC
jgi:flagellar basal body-associated protein FliL